MQFIGCLFIVITDAFFNSKCNFQNSVNLQVYNSKVIEITNLLSKSNIITKILLIGFLNNLTFF